MTPGSRREQVQCSETPQTVLCIVMRSNWCSNGCPPSVCFTAMSLGGTVDVLATDDPDIVAQEDEELQVYEKHNNLLHGSKRKR